LEAFTAVQVYILAFARRVAIMLPARLRLRPLRGDKERQEPNKGNSNRTGNHGKNISKNRHDPTS
jgi:hypothetical protein